MELISQLLFSQHLESMRHEICDCDIQLTQQGYRVDGSDGIKEKVNSKKRKSVDYYYIKSQRGKQLEQCIFVEFTDVLRGEQDLLPLKNLSKTLPDEQKKPLQKLLKKKSKDELTTKFNDSYHIYSKIPRYYQDHPDVFNQQSPKTFYIIHAPVNPQLPDRIKRQLEDFLPRLRDQVANSLDDDVCERVKLILIEDFTIAD